MKKINLITATTLIASLVIYGGLYSPYQSMALTQSWTTAGSGSWTIPANVFSITVETWGGGGGGGGIAAGATKNTITASGGGGGGAYASRTIAVTPGQTYYYTVGGGGTGGAAGNNNGTPGTASIFKSTDNVTILLQGNGGGGGGGAASGGAGASGLAGTTGATGTVKNAGGAGAAGSNAANGYGGGGGGGAAYGSAGGTATSATAGTGGTLGSGTAVGGSGGTGSSGATGGAGVAPGGGGAGTYLKGQTSYAGGAGGAGRVVISYTPATAPVVATAATVSAIGSVSATLGGSITGNGGAPVSDYGVVWSTTNTNPTVGGAGTTKVQIGTADITGAFSSSVSGLPQATRVYFAAYATNSVGTAYSTVYSFYTEPSTQASNVTITGITGTGMTISWTNGSGDGALVLMNAGSAVTGTPADGTYSYTASTTYGSGTLIGNGRTMFKGSGSSVTVSGLTAGTTYYVAVFASAGASTTSGANIGTNYVNSTPATASATAQNSAPVIGTVSVTPTVGSYTIQAPTVSASVSLASGTPSGCEYTVDNGSNWFAGTLTGSSSPWTCTAYPTGLSGSKQFNIRATAPGGTGTGTSVTRTVDSDLPVITTQSPADGANLILEGLTLTASATDASSGIDQYRIIIYNSGHAQVSDTGWTATTGSISYAPVGLSYSSTYYWALSVKDKVGNITNADERIFSIKGACVRNDPTVSLATPGDTVSAKILVDAGSALYRLRVRNNDVGGCSDSLFTLTGSNTFKQVTPEYPQDDTPKFNSPPTLGSPSVTVPAGSFQDIDVTVSAKTAGGADVSGVAYTTVTASNAQHSNVVSNQVLTVLNVAGCTKNAPLLTIGPDLSYAARGGSAVYTVSVKNNDAGANCAPSNFNLTKISDSLPAMFSSTLSDTVLNLKPGQAKTAYLTVNSASNATNSTVNVTTVGVSEATHPAASNKTATTTIGDTMIHNSDNLGSTKWGAGGWGLPGGRYGEIVCNTCHVPGGSDTNNIKRIREAIYTPYTGTHQHFPGEGRTLGLTKIMPNDSALPNATDASFGWDATSNKLTNPVKICEACHTYDPTGANGTKFHGQTGTALPSHYDGRDCLKCHKHNAGFGLAGMNCNFCHGDSSVQTQPTAANRFVVAPPLNVAGVTGAITGTGLVSNDPKVGAHQTHVRYLNGFSNYSTFDYRCEGCHGTLPTDTKHMNGSSPMTFQGIAVRGGMSPTFSSATLTCNNTYCHNPAGSGGTLANPGLAVMPSWTSASYIADGSPKTQTNCNRCHKSPGDSGFTFQAAHTMAPTIASDCTLCHGHNGDTAGEKGKRHLDGIRYAAKDCNNCHAYDTAGSAWTPNLSGGTGPGAHAIHINFIKSRLNFATLDPANQTFGGGIPAAICGTCHTNTLSEHTDGSRHITFGTGGTVNTMGAGYSGSMSLLFGASNPSFSTGAKSCSNLICHYATTPSWY